MLLLIWSSVLIAALVLYFRQTYSTFSSYGVKHLKVVPLFGNMLKIIFRMEHFVVGMDKMYKNHREERFVGRYEFIKPIIVPQYLELVKKITVKDFEHFLDHRGFTDGLFEPLFGRNLFSLKGQEWKDMRSTLSPVFTSSKIKLMLPFMEEVGEQMIRALKNKIKESDLDCIEVDVKDLTSRFANDVIFSCAFGLKVDSHNNEENQFYKIGKTVATFKFRQMMIFFLFTAFPGLVKKLNLKLFSEATNNFFIDLVMSSIKDREVHRIIRPDLIHLLMEAKKVWSDNDLIAQAVLFFLAGFETSSTAMSFTLHELALHPEIQERLVQEVKECNDKNGGKLNFNSIQNMTYMDMVTSEALRLWPPIASLDRVCVKDYNMGKPYPKSNKDYIIKKGDILSIPVWSFHRDPKIFPNPEKFDPERFSEENKHKINTLAYMPFGIGPRNCIGSRFALCELKVLLYQILLHLEVSPSNKTCIPAKLAPEAFNPRLQDGFWLKFKSRC